MNIFAHNGHDHTEEISQAASSNQVLITLAIAGLLLVLVAGILLLKNRKK